MLLTDRPITTNAQDELGRADFLRRLIRPLLEAPADSSIVIGLYGPWGLGKTSALNLLEARLAKANAIVIRFNPWLYGDTNALLISFFATLTAEVGGGGILSPDDKKRLKKGIATMSAFVMPALHIAPIPAVASTAIRAGFAGLDKLLEGGEHDFHKQKAKVASILHKLSLGVGARRVVVLIDDLDRADEPEILATLRLVKLVADLPNISYVLSMDDMRVRDVLSATSHESHGADFLDKIVQASVYLPPVPGETMRRLVCEAIAEELESAGLRADVVNREWYAGGIAYDETLGRRIMTLRDRARFVNAIRFFLQTGSSTLDVDSRDVILLTFLQTFFPRVYDSVRQNKVFLTGTPDPLFDAFQRDDSKEHRKKLRQQRFGEIAAAQVRNYESTAAADRAAVDRDVPLLVLRSLFPKADQSPMDESRRTAANEANQIASPDRFDRYFQLAPPPFEVADADVEALMADLSVLRDFGDPELEQKLTVIFSGLSVGDGGDHQESFVEKFESRIASLTPVELDDLARQLLKTEQYLGSEMVVRLTNRITELLLRFSFKEDIVAEPNAEIALAVVLREVGELVNGPLAILLADGISRHASARVRFSGESAVLAIAKAGADRADAYFAAVGDIYSVHDTLEANELLWAWVRLRNLRAPAGTTVRDYTTKLLVDRPERLSEVISCVAGWSERPAFASDATAATLRTNLGRIADVDQLLTLAMQTESHGANLHPDLIKDFLRIIQL